MTRNVFLLPLCILLILFGKNLAQEKCKLPVKDIHGWAKTLYDYVILYNISSSKPQQTCYDILESYQSLTKDELTFVYSTNGVITKRKAKVNFGSDNTVTFVYNDAPDQVVNVGLELMPNGVLIFHFCQGSQQDILLGHMSTKDVSKDVDDAATGLNANAADFKLPRNGCVAPTP